MDVLYPFRDLGTEELRYSLRSLRNLPHDRVWIVGDRPSWLSTRVNHVATPQQPTKWEDSYNNLKTALLNPEISEQFIYMNDDFFITSPVSEVPTFHRGSVRSHIDNMNRRFQGPPGPYRAGMIQTFELMQRWGIHDPASFELHIPMVFDKEKLYDLICKVEAEESFVDLHIRTLYGNYYRIPAAYSSDVKVFRANSSFPSGPWVSTSNTAFRDGVAGRRLRNLLPDPSPYEVSEQEEAA